MPAAGGGLFSHPRVDAITSSATSGAKSKSSSDPGPKRSRKSSLFRVKAPAEPGSAEAKQSGSAQVSEGRIPASDVDLALDDWKREGEDDTPGDNEMHIGNVEL